MEIEFEIITGENIRRLENGTILNRYSHLIRGCQIGKDCMIGERCYIAATAKIGNNVRIQNGVNIWDGVTIGDDVYIGANVLFTNHPDPHERHQEDRKFEVHKTIVKKGATISTGSIIVVGKKGDRVIGEYARIGVGSIIIKDIKQQETVNGVFK
jgi:UDP-2-acetamido-3-amino-2,3-dideoxy-glucuronate N-acetyltransferase